MHFTDIGNFRHEWHLDDLPWDAVTAVNMGNEHPEGLDEKLMDAITSRALTPSIEAQPNAKAAAIAFLYLYMTLAHGCERCVHCDFERQMLPNNLYQAVIQLYRTFYFAHWRWPRLLRVVLYLRSHCDFTSPSTHFNPFSPPSYPSAS